VEDHVHLVYGLSRTVTIAALTGAIKSASTKWIRETLPPVHNLGAFAWQGGYAIYSVSESRLSEVVNYVHNQESHHQSQTFEQEYRRLLELHGIAYDEAYVFD
jgi:REP element-mobilizing transposase RayT